MKKSQKALLITAIVFIVLGTFLAIIGGIASAGEIGDYMNRRWEENMDKEGFYDSQNDVESMDIDIKYGEVRIVSGDAFHIKCYDIKSNSIESYMEGKTWVIKDKFRRRGWSFLNHIFRNGYMPKIEITIPEGFDASEMNIVLDAGVLNVEEIGGEEVSIVIGAGKCSINDIMAKESLRAEVGAGQLEIYGMDSQNAQIECGAGRIYAEGVLSGDNEVDCGLGEIVMRLKGNPDQFNYKVDCGLGQVLINGDGYNVSTSINRNNQADNAFQINCGLGKVDLNVME